MIGLISDIISGLARLVWWLVVRPSRLGWLGAGAGLVWLYHTTGAWAATVVAVGILGLVVWAWRRPESFRRRVVWRLRGGWRGLGLRRRWEAAVTGCGLTGKTPDGGTWVPPLGPVTSSPYTDRFLVQMRMGQTIADWTEQAEALAVGLDADSCRIRTPTRRGSRRHDRRTVAVQLVRRDVLAEPVTPHPPAEVPEVRGLPVAMSEDGVSYRLPLLGTHLLVAGATGSGKGSVLWSIMAHLAPGISSGLVRVVGIDPKSLELPFGSGLFSDVVDKSASAMADALEHMVAVTEDRKTSMRGRSRLHEPTTDEPLYVVMIDEIAALTAYGTDRDTRKRVDAALGQLLTQGRAPGVSVIGALQDPRKEVLAYRNLFPLRIALRLAESGEVDMVLGDGARARGAACDQIPTAMPGTGYVVVEDRPEPVRVRFPFTSDTDIARLSRTYPAPRQTAANVSQLRTDDRGGEAA